jgi:hypothetical protein
VTFSSCIALPSSATAIRPYWCSPSASHSFLVGIGRSAARISAALSVCCTPQDGTKTWSPQKTEQRPLRTRAYELVWRTTASRMVSGRCSPPTW